MPSAAISQAIDAPRAMLQRRAMSICLNSTTSSTMLTEILRARYRWRRAAAGSRGSVGIELEQDTLLWFRAKITPSRAHSDDRARAVLRGARHAVQRIPS